MKYAILSHTVTGYIYPVVFDEMLVHALVVQGLVKHQNMVVLSAGFLFKRGDQWIAHGKSDSLKVEARPEDTSILNIFMAQGVSGLALANKLTLLELGLDPK